MLLREGKPARLAELQAGGRTRPYGMLGLMTSKPVLYVCNVEEGSAADGQRFLREPCRTWPRRKAPVAVVISAKIEEEIAQLSREERRRISGHARAWRKPGLNRLIRAGYGLLGLLTYLHRRAEGGARLDRDQRLTGARRPRA